MRATRMQVALVLVAMLVAAGATSAQLDWAATPGRPADDWRTLEVPGYRLHFPAPAEPWARHLAARLPALRERVATSVGWDADEVVDVVLADPIAQPNGAAWPLLARPRLVLLLTPPGASSQLGEFVDWPELLMTHEQAHLSHLLRPSRNPLVRMLRLPFGPLSLRAPRWTAEGYATVLEGRLTGSGRPSGALRAAVLRRWAQRGRLPSYAALSGDSRRYLGGAMAYLGGSAFLEWLEAGGGQGVTGAGSSDPGSFDRLWRRLTARKVRSFDGAFRGVYGESPEALWDRFTAELTWQALEVEKRLAGALREGEPWLDRSWGTGRPAVSRDGARLVVALSERDQPPRLAVYATADDADAARRREEERRELLARDPEDVPAIEGGAPAREPVATLELPGTTVDPSPRFLADGSVLFARTLPDRDGRARADLFRWQPDRSEVEQVTRRADVRAADPSPDGSWAAAVQSRWGETRLARVDLATGEVTPLAEGSVEVIVDAPRISPDGARVAFLRHRGEGWELVVREVGSGAERVVATPGGAAIQDPAWSPDGEALLAVLEVDGRLDVYALALGDDEATAAPPVPITRTLGAALAPEPTPDGKALFFLALEPEGLPVRRITLAPESATASETNPPSAGSEPTPSPGEITAASPSPPRPLDAAELHPALPPPAGAPPPPLALVEVPSSRDYGFGRGEWSQLSGGSAGPGAASAETGIRAGDVVGRWELFAVAAVAAAGGARGATVAGAWRGWPVDLTAQAYRAQEKPSAQLQARREAGELFDLTATGVELAATWQRPLLDGRLGARLAFGDEGLEPRHGPELSRRGVLLDAVAAKVLRRGRWRLGGELALDGETATTEGESWNRRGGRLELTAGRGRGSLGLAAARQELGGRPAAVDQLRVGGLPSTLLPPFATANRIDAPALPAAALVGSAYEGHRVTLALPRGPLQIFWERHRVERAEPRLRQQTGWSDWLSLAGAEFELRLPPLPLFNLPAARLQVGAAYGLDEPYRGDVNGWAVLAWRP